MNQADPYSGSRDQPTIPVTKAYLPPLEEYIAYLREIWNRGQLTNAGPLVADLERELSIYLGVKHLFLVSSGTLALQISIRVLELTGEVVTTPFSFVATTSSIVWEHCTPIFADIEPDTLTISPAQVEQALTSQTSAIVATHIYGNPCDVTALEAIAQQNGLRVIYDAAHAFGVEYLNTPICNYGDISVVSFHATKLFHTVEGGAIITNDDELAHRIEYMRNFGFDGPEGFLGLGINGKNSEFHAAMGLCILPRVQTFISERATIYRLYDELLISRSSQVSTPLLRGGTVYNYAFHPILLPSEEHVLSVRSFLEARRVLPKRYFHPPLHQLNYVRPRSVPVAEDVSKRVLCLPIYSGLSPDQVEFVSKSVLTALDR